jgi:hypothetical protein
MWLSFIADAITGLRGVYPRFRAWQDFPAAAMGLLICSGCPNMKEMKVETWVEIKGS